MRQVAGRRLGARLKSLRGERRLTLGGVEILSAQRGERINKSYLFRVERGRALPSLTRLIVLAQVLRVRLITLVETIESAIDEEGDPIEVRTPLELETFESLRERGLSAARGGGFAEAAVLLRAACGRAGTEAPPAEAAARRALARHDLAVALRAAGRLDLARREAEEALEERDLPGRLRDRILVNLAAIHARRGQCALARVILSGLLARKEEIPADTLASAHEEMGSALIDFDPGEAAAHYRAALSPERKRSSPVEHCRLLIRIGSAECRAGRYDRAIRRLTEARDLSQRRQLNYLAAWAASEIGKALYLKADREGARAALHDANNLARNGVYYDRLFVNHYYQRRLALDAEDLAVARATESSLRFFACHVDESLAELKEFREELDSYRSRDPSAGPDPARAARTGVRRSRRTAASGEQVLLPQSFQ